MPKKKDKKAKPDKQAKKLIKDFLKARKQSTKTKQQWDDICEGLIPDADELDNEEIAERLRGWMRGFLKEI